MKKLFLMVAVTLLVTMNAYAANVPDKTLSFPASNSPDVVGYKLYFQADPDPVTYESASIDLGNKTSVVLNTIFEGEDGVFNLGVVAVDDAGNESDMSKAGGVPLDFLPPNPPGTLLLE